MERMGIETARTKESTSTTRSTTGLLSDALANLGSLVRSEVDLARAEVNENVAQAGVAIGLVVGAVVVALVALNILAAALVAGLTEVGLEPGWAALLVGGGLALIAFLLMGKGLKDLKLSSLAPTRTAKNIQRDADAIKETYNEQ